MSVTAFCPRCRKETAFVESGGSRECSVCGLSFRHGNAPSPDPSSFGDAVVSVAKVLLTVILIMVAIVIVGVGVLFAGCALSGFHLGM